jgi:hypothetical protein
MIAFQLRAGRKIMLHRVLLGILFSMLFAPVLHAQDTSLCGPAPSEAVTKELSEKTKGDLEGKAQAISKLLGSADLGGKIETERKTLYQTSDSSEAIRADRYLFYVTCLLLMKDTTTPLKDKLDALNKLRQPVQPAGPSKSELMKQMLANFERSTTSDKIKEELGVPVARTNVSASRDGKTRQYPLERYEGTYADVFLIGNSPFIGIAVALKDASEKPKGTVPIPTYGYLDDDNITAGLGDLTLGDIKGACSGHLSNADARFLYVKIPVCYFGRGAAYNYFVFSFDGGAIPDTCNLDVLSLSSKKFEDIRCKEFWSIRPNFVLTNLGGLDDHSNGAAHASALASAILESMYWRQ